MVCGAAGLSVLWQAGVGEGPAGGGAGGSGLLRSGGAVGMAQASLALPAGDDGTDSANDSSRFPVYSPTGQAVAFVSRGSNFGPTDTNLNPDVYVARPPRRAS